MCVQGTNTTRDDSTDNSDREGEKRTPAVKKYMSCPHSAYTKKEGKSPKVEL